MENNQSFNVFNHLDAAIVMLLSLALPVFLISYYVNLSSKTLNNIFYLGLVAPTLLFFIRKRGAILGLIRQFFLLFIFLLAVSVIEAKKLNEFKYGGYLFVFFLSCLLIDRGKGYIQFFILPFCIVCAAILLYVTIDWLVEWNTSDNLIRYSDWFGTYFHPGFFSMIICFGLIVFWSFFIGPALENKYNTVGYIIGLTVFSLIVLLCTVVFQSRTALLGYSLFFIGLVIYKRIYWYGLLIVLLLALAVYGLSFDDLLANRGSSHRFIIWEEVWRQIYYECDVLLGCNNPSDYKILGKYYHPHNVYLALIYNSGVIGAVAFSLFAINYFYRGIKARSIWLVISLFGWGALLTENESLFTTPEPFWIYFWLPVFMTIIESNKLKVEHFWNVIKTNGKPS